ncbi:hypothetical protein HNO52_06585 [Billgrantia diversa]|uniref:hypothetical protein n=1 Tax=Halomonas sp. MCCC 1A13316 TaxID=2733487 RepID=UPI0018A3635D|nr:hypothetical protein [Halomonas sp. MCCC 1A13316]QOR38213.1 hypothetical protein HNO52_06585 [Halomonas sp. MCCC 1A13316]
MEAVREIALSFPVVVFTALLPLVLFYWLLVLLRLAPLELFARDSLKGDHLASTMVALGFVGVPVSFALSVLLGLAAAITLAIELAVLRWLPLGLFRIPVGVAVLWAAFVLASPLAASVCHALQRRFHRLAQSQPRCLLGEVVQVCSAADAQGWTTATLANDPACEVRLHGKAGDMPRPGERRVLVKFVVKEGAYRSVAESRYCEAREHLCRLRLARGRAGVSHGGAEAPL